MRQPSVDYFDPFLSEYLHALRGHVEGLAAIEVVTYAGATGAAAGTGISLQDVFFKDPAGALLSAADLSAEEDEDGGAAHPVNAALPAAEYARLRFLEKIVPWRSIGKTTEDEFVIVLVPDEKRRIPVIGDLPDTQTLEWLLGRDFDADQLAVLFGTSTDDVARRVQIGPGGPVTYQATITPAPDAAYRVAAVAEFPTAAQAWDWLAAQRDVLECAWPADTGEECDCPERDIVCPWADATRDHLHARSVDPASEPGEITGTTPGWHGDPGDDPGVRFAVQPIPGEPPSPQQ